MIFQSKIVIFHPYFEFPEGSTGYHAVGWFILPISSHFLRDWAHLGTKHHQTPSAKHSTKDLKPLGVTNGSDFLSLTGTLAARLASRLAVLYTAFINQSGRGRTHGLPKQKRAPDHHVPLSKLPSLPHDPTQIDHRQVTSYG